MMSIKIQNHVKLRFYKLNNFTTITYIEYFHVKLLNTNKCL